MAPKVQYLLAGTMPNGNGIYYRPVVHARVAWKIQFSYHESGKKIDETDQYYRNTLSYLTLDSAIEPYFTDYVKNLGKSLKPNVNESSKGKRIALANHYYMTLKIPMPILESPSQTPTTSVAQSPLGGSTSRNREVTPFDGEEEDEDELVRSTILEDPFKKEEASEPSDRMKAKYKKPMSRMAQAIPTSSLSAPKPRAEKGDSKPTEKRHTLPTHSTLFKTWHREKTWLALERRAPGVYSQPSISLYAKPTAMSFIDYRRQWYLEKQKEEQLQE